MKKTTISLNQEEVTRILADLEFLVVSLDRIGSAELAEDVRKAELYDFIIEGDVFKRLAAIRKSILIRLDQTDSPRKRRAIESTLEKVKPWKLKC
jgi:hypothetical protein